jgi:hypothetical protein
VIYEVNGQQISDSVREGDVFYFRERRTKHSPRMREP